MTDDSKRQRDIDATPDDDWFAVLAGRKKPTPGNSSEARAAALRDVRLRRDAAAAEALGDEDLVSPERNDLRVAADAGPPPDLPSSLRPRLYLAACVAGLAGFLIGHLWPESSRLDERTAFPAPELAPSLPSQPPAASRGPASEESAVAVAKGETSRLEAASAESAAEGPGPVETDLAIGIDVGVWLADTLRECDARADRTVDDDADMTFNWRHQADTLESMMRRLKGRTAPDSPALQLARDMAEGLPEDERSDDSVRAALCSRRDEIYYAIHESGTGAGRLDDIG